MQPEHSAGRVKLVRLLCLDVRNAGLQLTSTSLAKT
jgi:hypothetical protein